MINLKEILFLSSFQVSNENKQTRTTKNVLNRLLVNGSGLFFNSNQLKSHGWHQPLDLCKWPANTPYNEILTLKYTTQSTKQGAISYTLFNTRLLPPLPSFFASLFLRHRTSRNMDIIFLITVLSRCTNKYLLSLPQYRIKIEKYGFSLVAYWIK